MKLVLKKMLLGFVSLLFVCSAYAVTSDGIGDHWLVTYEDDNMIRFQINTVDEDVLTLYADKQHGNLFLQATFDGIVYTGKEIERLVAWDEMGRMSEQVITKPGLFNLDDFIGFYADNKTYQIDFSDNTFIPEIQNDTKLSPEALRDNYQLLQSLNFTY